MRKNIKGIKLNKKSVFSLAVASLLLSGCGNQGGILHEPVSADTSSVTTEVSSATEGTTQLPANPGTKKEYTLVDMTFTLSDVWGGDGNVLGDTVGFILNGSQLLLSAMEDSGDITNPEIKGRYRDGIAVNYDTEMSFMDISSIGGRPAFGITGDVQQSDGEYRLFSYAVRSGGHWYYLQFFQKKGEDHTKELEDFLAGISFKEEVLTDVSYTVGRVEFVVPSNWRGNGVLNENGVTYFYPDHGMLMIETIKSSGDLSSGEVQDTLLKNFTDGMDSGEMQVVNTFMLGNYFVMKAEGECTYNGSGNKMTALYIQVEDTVYAFTMGAFEGHFDDYDADVEKIFASVNVLKESATTESTEQGEGLRPEFKATMDEYEAFMTKYAEYLKKLKGDYDESVLAEYTEFVTGYNDTVTKLQEIDLNSLSPEEKAYYDEVLLRISQKLGETDSTP